MSPVFTNHHSIGVVWTRGKGCSELAGILAGGESSRIGGDLAAECIRERADLLVARKLPGSFDLVSVAIPVDFDPDKVTNVVAAVAGGPHSLLAAQTAARIGDSLGVPAAMVAASTPGAEDGTPASILSQIEADVPGIEGRVVEVEGVADLVEGFDDDALLVIGAPGGSWLQRAMFGPGAKIRRTAQAGAVVVRSAPDRVFRFMGEPVYVAPLRQADDTLRLHEEATLAVADEGRLVGVVRRQKLLAGGREPVASLMDGPVSVKVDETLGEAWAVQPEFGPDPIPVTDHEDNLVGGLLLPVA